MEALKPCPFCGGNAKVRESKDSRSEEGYSLSEVVCTKCGANVIGKPFNFYQIEYDAEHPQDVMSAVTKWNRRTQGGAQCR